MKVYESTGGSDSSPLKGLEFLGSAAMNCKSDNGSLCSRKAESAAKEYKSSRTGASSNYHHPHFPWVSAVKKATVRT